MINLDKDSHFRMFANCLLVKGHSRSAGYDLQRQKLNLIPNDLYEIVKECENFCIRSIYDKYGNENKETIKEYFRFLLENGFGHYINKKELATYQPIDTSYLDASKITNCIIEISQYTLKNFECILNKIEHLGCKNLQLISFEVVRKNELLRLCKILLKRRIINVNLIIKYAEEYHNSFFEKLVSQNLRLNEIIIFNSPKGIEFKGKKPSLTKVIFTQNLYKDFLSCGSIKSDNFGVENNRFFEAFNHNSCLFKKLSIDSNGNLKNCLGFEISFGNILESDLNKLLTNKIFNKYWNLTKDEVNVCKDCEFRYACIDCRAYTERNISKDEIDFSKPLKCGYDPYKGKWEDWATNPLKQEAIEYYKMPLS